MLEREKERGRKIGKRRENKGKKKKKRKVNFVVKKLYICIYELL